MMFFKNPVLNPASSRPQRILFIRFSGISGIVETIPAMIALRERFPKAEIAWLTERKYSGLLNGHPALDRLMFADNDWYKTLNGIQHLRQRLQIFKADAVLDFQENFRSAFAAWLSGAKARIGFTGNDSSFGSRIFNNILFTAKENSGIERNLTLLETFNVFGTSIAFDLPECETDRRNADLLLNRNGLNGNFAVFHIGYASKHSVWSEEMLADISKELLGQWNLPALIVCTEEKEIDRAENVSNKADGAVFLQTNVSLPEFVFIARKATLVVGNHSELLTVAAAVGTPTIDTGDYGNLQSVCDSCEMILSKLIEQKEKMPVMPFKQDIQQIKNAA